VLLFLFSALLGKGIKFPFTILLRQFFLPNNMSALHNADFVLGAITELLKVGSVV